MRIHRALAALFLVFSFLPSITAAQVPAAAAPPQMSALEREADTPFRASDWSKAAPAYEAVTKAEPANGRAHYRLGYAHINLKQYEPAAKALQGAVKLGFAPVLGNYNLACALARLGRKDEAFAALNASVQAGFTNLQQVQSDEDLTSLRDDARFAAVVSAMQRAAQPCEFDANYRAFDFWIGEWEVTPAGAPPNAPKPQSRIEKILNGCVILENWLPPGGAGGKSFNTFNPATKKWEQYWVSAIGAPIHFVGEARDGNMYYTSDSVTATGPKTLGKMTFFNLGPDRVRQYWETSTDGGKTWTVAFDAIYNRKK